MKNYLYILAAILMFFWIIGFYSTSIGSIIHVLFLMSVIALVAGISKDKKLFKKL